MPLASVITATELARNLSDLLNQVRYQGMSFDIKRGAELIAHVTPVRAIQGFPIERLDALLASLPGLNEAERQSFLDDVQAHEQPFTAEGDAWGS
jgi:antitoxin (DNA-binding transcriptional repressor) of toxin-antitoxin stability system